MTLGNDANFTEEFFITRYNTELANDFGNLANRITTLIKKNYNSSIPSLKNPTAEDNKIIEQGKHLGDTVKNEVDDLNLNKATDAVINFVRTINKYMEIRQPWKLVKTDKTEAGTVLHIAAEGLRLAANLLHPVMPEKMNLLISVLPTSSADNANKYLWGQLKPGAELKQFPTLFPRIKTKKKKQQQKKSKKKEQLIDFKDFLKLKFKTAKVLTAKKVENADKLLKVTVDAGSEKRQLVAGIAKHYAPEELIGKEVIIVANLKPAEIRGVKSEGMILAAEDKKQLAILSPDKPLKPGSKVS